MSTRTEHDTMGNVEVPSEAYWGAQTQRSRNNFKIGGETLPQPLIYALALVKKAAAATNVALGRIKPEQADLITQAADDVLNGKLDGQFPLVVWQTGSGTQSNMNMNEVLANRANEIAGTGLAAAFSAYSGWLFKPVPTAVPPKASSYKPLSASFRRPKPWSSWET